MAIFRVSLEVTQHGHCDNDKHRRSDIIKPLDIRMKLPYSITLLIITEKFLVFVFYQIAINLSRFIKSTINQLFY